MTKKQPNMRLPERHGAPIYWGLTNEGRIAGAIRSQPYRGSSYQRTKWWDRRRHGQWIVTEDFWHEIVVVEGADSTQAEFYSDYYDGPHELGSPPMVGDWGDFWLDDQLCLVVAFEEQRWGQPGPWFAEWDASKTVE